MLVLDIFGEFAIADELDLHRVLNLACGLLVKVVVVVVNRGGDALRQLELEGDTVVTRLENRSGELVHGVVFFDDFALGGTPHMLYLGFNAVAMSLGLVDGLSPLSELNALKL